MSRAAEDSDSFPNQSRKAISSIRRNPALCCAERDPLRLGKLGEQNAILEMRLQALEAFHRRRPILPAQLGENRARIHRLELLDVGGSNVLGGIGIALDVALGAMTQPPLQLIGIGASHCRKMERERMPEIVGAKR